MTYTLLTGSTGFLGRYLLKDCLLADIPLAVLVRSNKRESARQRLEGVMAHWDRTLGRALPRPVVLTGDVREPLCGLNQREQAWLGQHCETVIHSAASMKFHAAQPDGEPFHTNVAGTRNLLALCEAVGIRHFHQVSTAYVCGMRQGRVYENELDLGQESGNDYERSKIAAEKLIRGANCLHTVTVYRPASVIGDSHTGYTTNFHGFYSPLQVLYSMAKGLLGLGDAGRQIIDDLMKRARFMDRLNLRGDEGKNLVPVDWVSAVMMHILRRPDLHGQTYHLTPRVRTTVQLVRDVFEDVLREYAQAPLGSDLPPVAVPTAERESAERVFREQMTTYDSHWRDDPIFDDTHTRAAAPHLPCPPADRDLLVRTSRFAVQGNFGWPRPLPVTLEFDPAEPMRKLVEAGVTVTDTAESGARLNLEVTGPGGGQWTIYIEAGLPRRAQIGRGDDCQVSYYMNNRVFAALVAQSLTVQQAVSSGAVVVEAPREDARSLDTLQTLVKTLRA